MKPLILILIVLIALPSSTALNLYHNITMSYNNEEVSLDSISVTTMENYDLEYYRTLNDYTLLLTDKDSVRSIYYFTFELLVHVFEANKDGQIINEQDVQREQNTISVYLPYDEDATAIIIKDKELKDVLTIELKAPETEEKITEEKVETPKELPINYILAALIALLLIAILWMLLRKKKE